MYLSERRTEFNRKREWGHVREWEVCESFCFGTCEEERGK